jgi:hypothetical protein
MLKDIFEFAYAVITRWSALITVGILAACLVMRDFFSAKRLPKRFYFLLLLFYFICAAFLIWRSERLNPSHSDEQIKALKKQLESCDSRRISDENAPAKPLDERAQQHLARFQQVLRLDAEQMNSLVRSMQTYGFR